MDTNERLVMRDYQEYCLNQVKQKNSIVSMGTGLGKTLIALRFIEYCLDLYRDKVAVFLVPTQALVEQQANWCKEQIQNPAGGAVRVLTVVGDRQAGWGHMDWTNAAEQYHVFVGTPAIIEKALITQKYLQMNQFCVVICDECHYAKKKSSMATILRDAVHPYYRQQRQQLSEELLPRILGLTASFASGKITNLVQDRHDLEVLLHATMISPNVEQERKEESFQRVLYGNDPYHTEKHVEVIDSELKETLQKIGRSKDSKKAFNQCKVVFRQLGRGPFFYYLEHAIIRQIEAKITNLECLDDENALNAAKNLKRLLPALRKEVASLSYRLRSTVVAGEREVPILTSKLARLIELLKENFTRHGSAGYKGIVFVREISLVAPLAKQINTELAALNIKCGVVAGVSAQTMSEKKCNLDVFRGGQRCILVATAACEEGLDVPDCQFVVQFAETETTKSDIQRTGRARHVNAELYYFENDPSIERCKAASVIAVARNSSLALSTKELAKRSEAMGASISDKHPYPFDPAERDKAGIVTVKNCKEIFMEYCASVLGQPVINPTDELYTWSSIQGTEKKVIKSVKCPTPEGWKEVNRAQASEFWKGVELKVASAGERDERRLVYLAVVELRKAGLLTMNNKASEEALELTKLNCPLQCRAYAEGVTFKQKVSFKESQQDMLDMTNLKVTLENITEIFQNYLQLIFGVPVPDLTNTLFEYRTMPTPSLLKFPSPRGWETISLDQHNEVFRSMEIDDQLDPGRGPRSPRQKVEIGMIYCAVHELYRLGYLDEDYQPVMSPAALQYAKERCQLPSYENEETNEVHMGEFHSVISISATSISELSMPAATQGPHATSTVPIIPMDTSVAEVSYEMTNWDFVNDRDSRFADYESDSSDQRRQGHSLNPAIV